MVNPYSPSFGKSPEAHIERLYEKSLIIEDYTSENPKNKLYVISGTLGAGKSIFLSDLSQEFFKRPSWTSINLDPERDLLSALAFKLSSQRNFKKIFDDANINFAFGGITFGNNLKAPITDEETAISKMLKALNKTGSRILVTIDDAIKNDYLVKFLSSFQFFLREKLPIYLLISGTLENIWELQSDKALSFIQKEPRISLKPLNLGAISKNYMDILHVSENDAHTMAKLTNGYPFAFQVLGYLWASMGGPSDDLIPTMRQYLEEYIYEKIWFELSPKDRDVAYAISNSPDGKIRDIRMSLNMESNEFSPYRDRLIKKGLIDGADRGSLSFTLPFFSEYVKECF